MTALIIIGIILGLALFIFLGYYLWSVASENYDYNIFNIWVVLRGIVAFICLYFALIIFGSETDDGSSLVLLAVGCLLWIWTFIATTVRTNFFIAFFAVVYQAVASLLLLSILNRIFNRNKV